ncbi:hypothetical protein [Piscinibacter sp.]|uniref:hypothetical protein n=1 Tax=Piscinibacter sp. TaxID=1903157 RepID=UPI0039E234BC
MSFVLPLLAALLALGLALHGPIPQWDAYHHFADQRAWLAIPHATDVLSNLPFALLGCWALWAGRALPRSASSLAWRAFAWALVATAAGSSLYHWAPDNTSLVFDRLPIAWACAALTCAFLAERLDARWGSPAVLATALLAASASVALWWGGERLGRGDLRAYLFVQFLPMLLVPAALLLRAPKRFVSAAPDAAWWGVLLGYALAKGLELADHAVFEQLAVVSGHTLKHLVAAGAAGWLLAARGLNCGSRR